MMHPLDAGDMDGQWECDRCPGCIIDGSEAAYWHMRLRHPEHHGKADAIARASAVPLTRAERRELHRRHTQDVRKISRQDPTTNESPAGGHRRGS